MTLSGNQPYFLPYLPYWQLIYASDVFLIADDFNFIENSWITRNRLLIQGTPHYFHLDVSKQSSNKPISDLSLAPQSKCKDKLLRQLFLEYRHSKNFDDAYSLLEFILSYPDNNLARFISNSILIILEYLEIKTTVHYTSEYHPDDHLKNKDKVVWFCNQCSADSLINLPGGRELYDPSYFLEHGIDIKFINSSFPRYHQKSSTFIPGLSILDIIMNCSRTEVQDMLPAFSLSI